MGETESEKVTEKARETDTPVSTQRDRGEKQLPLEAASPVQRRRRGVLVEVAGRHLGDVAAHLAQ